MNYRIHENGWTVIIDDYDLNTATQQDINFISNLIAEHTLVVIKRQSLTVDDEYRIVKMFDVPTALYQPEDDDYAHVPVPGTDGYILRVGGEVNEHGVPGIAEHVDEMAWHHDFHWQLEHKPSLIMLHGIRGVKNSTTVWINNVESYQDLDDETKGILEPLENVMLRGTDFNVSKFYTDADGTRWPHGIVVEGYYPKVVRPNKFGKTGMYFPFNQIYNFKGMSREESKEILLKVSKFITQDKYKYTHIWDTGDIIISDQWFGLHMRYACDHIERRLIHRAMFDYPKDVQ
jgi:alpha-ketoglutarate-dependent taurine dioxygenase